MSMWAIAKAEHAPTISVVRSMEPTPCRTVLKSPRAGRSGLFLRQLQSLLPGTELGMIFAVRPQAVREPRCNEKKERWLLAAVLPAPHRQSIHWLDVFRGCHHSILAANCFKIMTVPAWQLGVLCPAGREPSWPFEEYRALLSRWRPTICETGTARFTDLYSSSATGRSHQAISTDGKVIPNNQTPQKSHSASSLRSGSHHPASGAMWSYSIARNTNVTNVT